MDCCLKRVGIPECSRELTGTIMGNRGKFLLSEAAAVAQEYPNTQLEPIQIMKSAMRKGLLLERELSLQQYMFPLPAAVAAGCISRVAAAIPAFLNGLSQEKTSSKETVNMSDQSELFQTYSL